MADFKLWLQALWSLRNLLLLVLIPIVLSPLLVTGTPEAKCAYCVLIVSFYWMFVILPLSITALIPLFLFPILGVMKSNDVAVSYILDAVLFVMGTFFVAMAIERWNVHKRLALLSLLLVGTNPASILLCFMVISFSLSMWMSNTATASMIIPLARAMAGELMKQRLKTDDKNNPTELVPLSTETKVNDCDEIIEVDQNSKSNSRIESVESKSSSEISQKGDKTTTAFELGVAYSSLMGGAATLIGTPQTLFMKLHLDRTYGPEVMSFGSWFAVGAPCQVSSVLIGWVWLQWLFLDLSFKRLFSSWRCRKKRNTSTNPKTNHVKEFIRGELKKLGPVSVGEASVLCILIVGILVWFSAKPNMFPGWTSLDKNGYISITQSALLLTLGLFILPANPREAFNRFRKDTSKQLRWDRLMDTNTTQTEFPWMITFLTFGCGLSMGKACQTSGLSAWIASTLKHLGYMDPWIVAFILIVGTAVVCECIGNAMVVIVMLPILSELAHSMEVNPLYFIIPSTLAATFAFMLPISSGPNIVAFAHGDLLVSDMVKSGSLMNVICILINNIGVHTLCVWVFDIYTYPDWAPRTQISTNLTTPGYGYTVL